MGKNTNGRWARSDALPTPPARRQDGPEGAQSTGHIQPPACAKGPSRRRAPDFAHRRKWAGAASSPPHAGGDLTARAQTCAPLGVPGLQLRRPSGQPKLRGRRVACRRPMHQPPPCIYVNPSNAAPPFSLAALAPSSAPTGHRAAAARFSHPTTASFILLSSSLIFFQQFCGRSLDGLLPSVPGSHQAAPLEGVLRRSVSAARSAPTFRSSLCRCRPPARGEVRDPQCELALRGRRRCHLELGRARRKGIDTLLPNRRREW